MFFPSVSSGFGAGGGGVTFSSHSGTVITTDLTAYTFSGHAIGVADTNRKVVVIVNGAAAGVAVSTLTIGGVSATSVVGPVNNTMKLEMWQAIVPTGTTGDIVVTWGSGNIRCGIGVFAVFGAASAASATATSTADPMSASITIPGGGVCIGGGADDNTSNYAWTNLTETYDQTVEAATSHTGAADAFNTLQTGRTITCNPSNAAAGPAMVLAAWGPA